MRPVVKLLLIKRKAPTHASESGLFVVMTSNHQLERTKRQRLRGLEVILNLTFLNLRIREGFAFVVFHHDFLVV
jgi:hypothetical protein